MPVWLRLLPVQLSGSAASGRPRRVTMRCVSWLFSVQAGAKSRLLGETDDVLQRAFHRLLVPGRQHEVEGEHLMELVGAREGPQELRPPCGVRLGDHHQVTLRMGGGVVVDHRAPPTPHDMALLAEHRVRVGPGDVEHADLRPDRRLVGQCRVLADGA